MPQDVLTKIPSFHHTKALYFNSFDGTPISYPLPTPVEPINATAPPVAGQVYIPGSAWNAGEGGDHSFNRILVQPYCEGPAGSQFWVRVYGWRPVGGSVETRQTRVWLPTLLVQLFCIAGDLSGSSVASGYALLQTENLCDTISLVSGWPGATGEIVSSGPGFAAFAEIELRGAKKFSFEFEQSDNVGMNALWAPC